MIIKIVGVDVNDDIFGLIDNRFYVPISDNGVPLPLSYAKEYIKIIGDYAKEKQSHFFDLGSTYDEYKNELVDLLNQLPSNCYSAFQNED
jgi:hypothetical protein